MPVLPVTPWGCCLVPTGLCKHPDSVSTFTHPVSLDGCAGAAVFLALRSVTSCWWLEISDRGNIYTPEMGKCCT